MNCVNKSVFSPPRPFCVLALPRRDLDRSGPALERRFIALPWLNRAHHSGLTCIVHYSKFGVLTAAEGHVWTAPAVQEESDYQRSVRVRSCIRPLNAAVWPLALM